MTGSWWICLYSFFLPPLRCLADEMVYQLNSQGTSHRNNIRQHMHPFWIIRTPARPCQEWSVSPCCSMGRQEQQSRCRARWAQIFNANAGRSGPKGRRTWIAWEGVGGVSDRALNRISDCLRGKDRDLSMELPWLMGVHLAACMRSPLTSSTVRRVETSTISVHKRWRRVHAPGLLRPCFRTHLLL